MLINRSVEEGIIAMLMLACQRNHMPVSGRDLSAVMRISESYLKKTMRKLVVADLVVAVRTREGGFILSRPAPGISLGDIARALMGEGINFQGSTLARDVFVGCDRIPVGEKTAADAFGQGMQAFFAVLDEYRLSDLLRPGVWEEGTRDWKAIAEARRENAGV